MFRSAIVSFFLIVFALSPTWASPPGPWNLRASLFYSLESAGLEGAPSPINGGLGFAYYWDLGAGFAWEPGLDIWGNSYAWSDNLDRPVPIELENRTTMVVHSLISLPAVYELYFGRGPRIRFALGPGFDLTIPLVAEDLKDEDLVDAKAQTEKILAFEWGNARYLQLLAGIESAFKLTEGNELAIGLRALFPLWRLWSPGSFGGMDRFRFALGLSYRF